MRLSQDVDSFRCAFRGVWIAFRSQRNMKIHMGLTVLSLGAGLALGLAPYEWMVVLLAIGMVASAELFNTVAESLADLVAPEHSVSVQRIKDLSAGAVLLAAGGAAAVAFLIFPRKLLLLLGVDLWPFTG